MADSAQRHLDRSALQDYLTRVAPATIVIPGDPTCRLVFYPQLREMALRTTYADAPLPDLTAYEHVDAQIIEADGAVWAEVTLRHGLNGHEAYLMLSDIVDMLQQRGLNFAAAVLAAIDTFEDLLARTGTLSPEKQTGLYGELLFLESCLVSVPTATAVSAWKGYAPHEHDFVLPGVCFEIKTTKTERRRHRIGSLEQLEPLPGTPLWLISVQLTSAGPGIGRTLTELVDHVCQAAGPARTTVEAMLARAGWRDRDRALYQDHQTLRSLPAAYLVDDGFPVLNRRIVQQNCARPALILDADYTIDVTSMQPHEPPHPADRFVQGDD